MITNEPIIKNSDLVNSLNRTGMIKGNQGRILDRQILLTNYTNQAISTCWNSLCTFIAQNYSLGKGTHIKGFGTFTFNNYEVNLEGTTNQFSRDTKQRTPVFIVSQEFLDTLKPGQYTKSGLIYYNQRLNNSISHVKVNYAEISYSNSISKDECANIIQNLLKHIGDSIRNGTFLNKDLPGVGVLLLSRNIIGIKFNEDLISNARCKPTKLQFFKKNTLIGMDLTNASNCCAAELIDPEAKAEEIRPQVSLITKLTKTGDSYMKKVLNIDVSKLPVHEISNIYSPCASKQLSQSQEIGVKFINDRHLKAKGYTFGKKLRDLNLSKDVLESFEFFKGVLISNMKKLDRAGNGKIRTIDCINILSTSNIHPSIDNSVANMIVDLYSMKLDEIDYMKFVACLIKDARVILFNHTVLNTNENETKNNKYCINTLSNRKYTNNNSYIKEYKNNNAKSFTSFSGAPTPRMNSTSYPTMRLPKIKLTEAPPSLQSQKKEIDSIKKELNAIRELLPELKYKNKTRLDQNMSIDEFMNILSQYNISYPRKTIMSILHFLEIENFNKFSLNDIEEHMNHFIVLTTVVTDDDIQLAFRKAKDVFFFNGGKAALFKSSNELTRKQFVDLFQSSMNEEVILGLYNYLVKTNRNFTINDYENFFELNRPVFDENYELKAMRIINAFIAKKHLKSEEYFDHLLTYNISTKNKVLARPDFIRAFQCERYTFSAEELDYIFGYIDKKKDEVIDREEFLSKVNYVTLPLSELQHIIQKNRLDIEDLAHRMQIVIEVNQKLPIDSFKEKIKMLDYTLSNEFLTNLFNSMKDKPSDITVNSQKIIEEFDVFKKEFIRSKGKTNYIPSFKGHFNKIVKEKIDFNTLKSSFEEIDEQCTGIISKGDYCLVMRKYFNEFTDEEIIKFVRITNMFDDHNINVRYPDLLNLLYYREGEDKFTMLCDLLKKILNNKFNGSIEKMLMKINNKEKVIPITIESLKSYLASNYNETNSNSNNIAINSIPLKIYCKLDIDADGLISIEDLQSALGRYTKSSYFKYENKEDQPSVNMYPNESMKDSKFKALVKRLKSYMKAKNITEIGLFKKLDINNDGFISAVDFSNTIDSILPLAPAIKDQFFNYLDYYHNGLVDQETFIFRFKDFSSGSVLSKNNNTIENVIIEEIGNFIHSNPSLSETEIFSLIDKDSDGIISIHDFKKFITVNLLISKYDFNDYKLERVMQALSLSKNKMIGLNDVKEFMNKTKSDTLNKYHMNLKEIFKVTTNQNLFPSKDNSEWINEIIERFGMFISEKYGNVHQFFNEAIEKGERKFRYDDFVRFHEKNWECFNNGFNLTKDELLAVFTSLDSQKKNYLLLEDLETKLQVFDFYKKMHIDVKGFIKQNFYNGVDAFKFFIDQKGEIDIKNLEQLNITTISKKNFFDTFEYFFPKKYPTETILKYFTKNFKSNIVSFVEFNYLYFDNITADEKFLIKKSNDTKLLTSRRDTILDNMNRSHSEFRPKKEKLITPFDDDALNKIKRILQSTKFDLEAYFNVAELKANKGIVNKFQFRNLIKKLDIGLTNLEIDDIISKSGKMTYDGKLNLLELIKYLKGEDANITEGKQNTSVIIGNIKNLIYKYYSNPVVCFQLHDKNITLRLDFERFKRIVTDMYNKDHRDAPNFTMLKNAYDVLDLRKDGALDMNEWMKAFGSFNGSMDLRSNSIDNGFTFYNSKKNNKNTFLNANRKVLREWESSSDICQLYQQIAKNKKIIKETLKNYLMDYSGNQLVLVDNIVNAIKEALPMTKLSHTQWKMLVMIGKSDHENMIDLGLFFCLIEQSAKNMRSHPRKFLK